MKMEDRISYAKHRLTTAFNTLEAARLLANNGYWNSGINRLYYAAFYAVNALLVFNEIDIKSHTAVKSNFSLHFIKTGVFRKDYGRLFSQLYDWRQKSDYDSMVEFEKEEVEPLIEIVNEFIDALSRYIESNT